MATLWRLPQVLAESGKKRSPLYAAIKNGTWTRPVKCGLRSVAWPADEVRAINQARIAGKDDDAIRALVRKLELARTEA